MEELKCAIPVQNVEQQHIKFMTHKPFGDNVAFRDQKQIRETD